MIIDELIYDRSSADVTALYAILQAAQDMTPEQRISFLVGLKGAYNYTDMNRVEGAVSYLSGLLQSVPTDLQTLAATLGVAWDEFFDLPYDPAQYTFTTKTNWAKADLPTTTDMTRYLGNVTQIITALTAVYPTLPTTMSGLTFAGANNIEQALSVLYNAFVAEKTRIETLLENTAATFVYSGQPYSGQIWSEFTV